MELPNTPERPSGSRELSGRSREVRETLSQLSGRAVSFYEGALGVFADRSNPVRAEAAAYCLRELIEALERAAVAPQTGPRLGDLVAGFRTRWVAAERRLEDNGLVDHADPAVFATDRFLADASNGRQTRRDRAQETFTGLDPVGLRAPADVHEVQISALLNFRDDFNYFLHGDRPADVQAFAARFASFETFLLAWLRPRTFEDFRAIDRIVAEGAAELIQRDDGETVRLIRSRPANLQHFLSKLLDASWLPVLLELGFFKNPTPPEKGTTDDGRDWVRFPSWPESQYLARVAAEAPDLVAEAIESIPETSNPRVHQDIVAAAIVLPGELAARIALRERRWLAQYDGPFVSYPQPVGALLAHLADEGQAKAALRFAGTILRISELPESESFTHQRRAAGLVDDWEYGRIVAEAWPALMRTEPVKAFRFLCHQLADVIEISYVRGSSYDSTHLWRSAIEDHEQNHGHSLLDTLIDAVRDTAVDAAAAGNAGEKRVLEELARHTAPLFRRLELFMLARFGSTEQVVTAVADPAQIDDFNVWHEYAELLKARFGELDPGQRARVLAQIAAGPDRELSPAQQERGVSAEQHEASLRFWRLERYVLIEGHLQGEAAADYDALIAEFGKPDRPTFRSIVTTRVGDNSPYSPAELLEIGPRGVVDVLRTWVPRGGLDEPSQEGLASALELAVEQDAKGFAEIAPEFADLTYSYVRGLLGGLTRAVKAGSRFGWEPVLGLCRELTGDSAREQPSETSKWLRQTIVELLAAGLDDGDAEFGPEHRDDVWSIVEALLDDADPTPGRDAGSDPSTVAVNSVRGQALDAAVRYALWIERSLRAAETLDGIGSIPEFAAAIERRLDPTTDQSLAIRAVLGRWFVQFVRMDEDWARTIAPRVFPTDADGTERFAAAWNAYVIFNQPYTSVFKIMHESYQLAAERFEEVDESRHMAANPRERLGEHLAHLVFIGDLGLDAGEAFATFWRNAPNEIRKHVISDVGWSLEHSNAQLEAEVAARIVATWEWILEHSNETPQALESFGAWFGAEQLDEDWLLAQGRRVLDLGLQLMPEHVVFEALARMAGDRPDGTVDVLRRVIVADGGRWRVLGSEHRVRRTLQTVLASDSERARSTAIDVLNLLGARGLGQYRDLMAEDDVDET